MRLLATMRGKIADGGAVMALALGIDFMIPAVRLVFREGANEVTATFERTEQVLGLLRELTSATGSIAPIGQANGPARLSAGLALLILLIYRDMGLRSEEARDAALAVIAPILGDATGELVADAQRMMERLTPGIASE